MGQRLPLQTVYKLLVCIWLKEEVYSIKKILPLLHRLLLWGMCVCPACFGVYMDTWSHAAEEMIFPAPLLPPAPAEQSYSASWVGLRNLSSKSSNFCLCGCYSRSHGKGIKLAAKRQHRLFGTKECFSTPASGHMHLLATHEDEELMHTLMPPSVLQFPGEESWVAQGKRHTAISNTSSTSAPICSTTWT